MNSMLNSMDNIEKARRLANLGKPTHVVSIPHSDTTIIVTRNSLFKKLQPLKKKEYKYIDVDLIKT